MGVSTDGLLVYGYDLGSPEHWEESPEWYNDEADEDFSEQAENYLLKEILGFDTRWPEEADEETRKNFWKQKKEAKENLGVEILYHCSYEWPMYFLAAKEFRAYRGYPVALDYSDLAIDFEWDEKLNKALSVLDVKVGKAYPSWFLASLWG